MGGWIAGVDGCPKGWIVARQPLGMPHQIDITVLPRFDLILDISDPPSIVAVDMPIGLPARVGAGGRGPERAIRPFLGKRKSSVFSVPSRSAVEAPNYETACAKAADTSDPSRKVSKQAFMLFPKIREIDQLLRASPAGIDPPWIGRVFEVHPELAFWRMNGEKPLSHAKKTRSGAARIGSAERIDILREAGFSEGTVSRSPPSGAALDDMLDSLAALWVARRIYDRKAEPFPRQYSRDGAGLPIAVWA